MQGIPTIDDVVKAHVIVVLDTLDGNVVRAARALDIDRRTLYRKLEKWGITRASGEFVERLGEAR